MILNSELITWDIPITEILIGIVIAFTLGFYFKYLNDKLIRKQKELEVERENKRKCSILTSILENTTIALSLIQERRNQGSSDKEGERTLDAYKRSYLDSLIHRIEMLFDSNYDVLSDLDDLLKSIESVTRGFTDDKVCQEQLDRIGNFEASFTSLSNLKRVLEKGISKID